MTITNTLENAKRLEKLGLTPEQAQGVSEIVEEAARAAQPDLSELVTKDFLRAELGELRLEFASQLRQQMLWFFAMLVAVFGAAFTLARFISVP